MKRIPRPMTRKEKDKLFGSLDRIEAAVNRTYKERAETVRLQESDDPIHFATEKEIEEMPNEFFNFFEVDRKTA